MTAMQRPARSCARCGSVLSSYNDEQLCGSCQRTMSLPDASALPDGPWLERHEHLVRDDAGDRLRQWRLLAGRSQESIATALGMTQQHLSQIENGKRPLSVAQRRLIVAELGVASEDMGLVPYKRAPADDTEAQVAASAARWRAQRRWLNRHRADLARLAVALYPEGHRIPGTTLIADPRWIPYSPMSLRSVALELDEMPRPVAVDGSEPATRPVRPLRSPGTYDARYTAAIRRIDPPHLFESRPSYRLLDVDLDRRRLQFGMSAYFDKLDVSEALGHEMAIACLERSAGMPARGDSVRHELPFRRLVGDPFDPTRRAVIPAVTTLTIRLRRWPAEPSFLLHWRDPAKVATAGGGYDVVPAGEFQPSSVDLWDRRHDFDLWKNIVREYSEELLGQPEHNGTRTAPIDYERWQLFQSLEVAQAEGCVSAFLLGLGLDALTLAATILIVVVIGDDVFAQLFGDAVRYNDEGEIVTVGDGRAAEGVPFTESAVERMLTSEPMASPGAACLALAWQHRNALLGT